MKNAGYVKAVIVIYCIYLLWLYGILHEDEIKENIKKGKKKIKRSFKNFMLNFEKVNYEVVK